MLNTLNYRSEWIEMINTLPDQNDRNALIAAITMYQFNGQVPELSPTLNLVFLFIKKEIDTITLQLQAEAARKEARRTKRTAKPTTLSVQTTTIAATKPEAESSSESEPSGPHPADAPQPDITGHSEEPTPDTIRSTPVRTKIQVSKNKNFNAILRAKEHYDRQKRHTLHPQ